jgi:hypothetical protein
MKKITTLFIALLLNSLLMAQIPTGSFFEFEFAGGSLANTYSPNSPSFSGSINSIADRDGNVNHAADITGVLSGAYVGAANVNEMTLSFWMKHAPLTSNQRILQVYGTGGKGFRLQMTGSQLIYNASIGDGSASISHVETGSANIDNNIWHHIVVRTTSIDYHTIEFDVFIDNVLVSGLSNTTMDIQDYSFNLTLTNFLMNANLVISPTNNYTGDIDDIHFYKSSLTDAQVTQLYNYSPCPVYIPDANFKAYLVGNAAINTNGDTEIQCGEANAFTGTINCTNQNISDLTGIEAFTALDQLFCSSNGLSSIDVTANTLLTRLDFNNNNISTIDLSANQLIKKINCQSNQLQSIDLTTNNDLEQLDIRDNSLTALDLVNNTALVDLNCRNTSITSLNTTSNINLEYIVCNQNSINSLDFSTNVNLLEVFCNDNSLTSLNIANGNNTNINFVDFINNANLTCIEVDDVTYSTSNWTSIDSQASFSTNCSASILVSTINVQGVAGVSIINTFGGTLQMEATVLPANATDATYTWSVTNGTGSTSIDANGLLTALTNGTVEVIATANDASGITGTKTITISNQSVGINDLGFDDLSIYPNPTNNLLNINVVEGLSSIRIMGLTGKTIKVFNAEKRQLDISELTAGIYFLEIANAEKKSVMKIIKR